MQEAYRPPCSKYSLCCPNWVPPHPDLVGGYLTWVPPRQGTPPTHPPAGPGRVLPQQGIPRQGTPPRVPPPAGPGRVPPSGCPMAFWEMLQSIMGYGYHPPPPPVDRQMEGQTHVKTLPSRHTTYTGGNEYNQ